MAWEQLLEYRRQVAEAARDEAYRRERPTVCPDDGTPLEENSAGILECRFAGFVSRGAVDLSDI